MSTSSRLVPIRRSGASSPGQVLDRVAVEAGLEVRLHGEPFSIIMRTPGDDRHLTAGFLFSEGILLSASDVASINLVSEEVVDVTLSDARAPLLPHWLDSRRQVAMNASCGMCGRRSLEALEIDAPPLRAGWTISADILASLPLTLRGAQTTFDETGGLHAAGLFRPDGTLEASAEDVGRHNAVDKLIGGMLLAGRLPLSWAMLAVSGRSSFEILQKAFLAGVPLVAAVSAPSTLAVDLAERIGITLLGFVRDGRFNVYAHPERVRFSE
jgi:FdhD protein